MRKKKVNFYISQAITLIMLICGTLAVSNRALASTSTSSIPECDSSCLT